MLVHGTAELRECVMHDSDANGIVVRGEAQQPARLVLVDSTVEGYERSYPTESHGVYVSTGVACLPGRSNTIRDTFSDRQRYYGAHNGGWIEGVATGLVDILEDSDSGHEDDY